MMSGSAWTRALVGGVALLTFGAPLTGVQQTSYDMVIAGGRVIDPESGLDAIRHVGIDGGTIRIVSESPLRGRESIDAAGLVVSPGFIDLHHHSFEPAVLRAKVRDGVTAAFELELGTGDVGQWYRTLEGTSPIHVGVAAGHAPARAQALGARAGAMPAGETATRAMTPEEMARLRGLVEDGLRQGALGVGIGVEYTPGATTWELLEMFRAAAGYAGAPVFVHVRGTDPPQHWMETAELFLGAVTTGAPLHIVHANSSYGRDAPRLFEMIAAARQRGLDVTTEAYPYTASMAPIESAPFDDWQTWDDERFGRFVWPATGERLTRESFGRYRATGGVVVIEGMTEDRLRPALASPLTMIVSDGVAEASGAHPRVAGTYARILGRYVREQQLLTLPEALRKMTLMPAQRLEARAPAMRNKGRIQPGADADITVFDPDTVIDRATYADPLLPSAGIVHVLVSGVPVVHDGALTANLHGGRGIRAAAR